MKLYHGTRLASLEAKRILADFPIASKATNGVGFYLTNSLAIAQSYGSVLEYEVGNDWVCGLVRPLRVGDLEGMEYVLTQREADCLVVDHAHTITIH